MSSLDDPLLAPRPMTFQERLLEARAARAAAANAAAAAAAAGRGGGAGAGAAGAASADPAPAAPPYFFGAVAPSSTAPSSGPGTPTYRNRREDNSFDADAFQGARRKGSSRPNRREAAPASAAARGSLSSLAGRKAAAAAKLAAAARSRAKGAAVAACGAGGVVLALSGWGLVIALFLTRSLAPAAVELGRDLWVDYTLSPAVGVASFLPEGAAPLPASFSSSSYYSLASAEEKAAGREGGAGAGAGMGPADAARARAARPFPAGRRLDIWLSLEAPLDAGFSPASYSPSAAAAAMVSPSSDLFQVRAELLSPEGRVLASASRPAMLPRRSAAARLLRSLLLAPLVVAGLASGDEVAALRLPLFSGYREAAESPLVAVRVALQGRGAARGPPGGAGGGPAPPPALRSLTAHARQRLPLLAAVLYRVRPGDALAAPLFLLGASGVLVGSTVAAGAAAVWLASAKERAALAAAAEALRRDDDGGSVGGDSSPYSSRFGGGSSFAGDEDFGGPSPMGTGYSGELSDTGEEDEDEGEGGGDFGAAPEEFHRAAAAAAAASAAAGRIPGGVASFQRRQEQQLQRNQSDATEDFSPIAESVERGGGGDDDDDDDDEEEEEEEGAGEEEAFAEPEEGSEFEEDESEEAPAAAAAAAAPEEPVSAPAAPAGRRIGLSASLSEAFRRRRARSSSTG